MNLLRATTPRQIFRSLSKPHFYGTLVMCLVLFLLPNFLGDFTISQLSLFSCYGLLAISLALVWGQLGLLCLGQAIFFGIGAYAMGMNSLDMIPFINHTTQTTGFLLATVLPMLVAYFLSLFLFNGRQVDGAYLGLVTLALAVMVERFFSQWNYAGGSNGLYGISPLQWQGEVLSTNGVYYLTLSIVVLISALLYYYKYSYCGLMLKAIRENENRAKHLGINTKKIKTNTFVISAGIAGIAGALFATQLYFVSPQLVGFALSTEVLIWVAVGGRYSFTAAFFGAIFIRLLEDQLGSSFEKYWQLVLGFMFVAVVLFFPKGVFGKFLR